MKKNIYFIFISTLIISCSQSPTKEYHDNGKVWKEYYLKDDKLHGDYKEYFTNGKLKLIHSYREGKNCDTSFYFHKTPVEQLQFKRIWHNIDSIEQLEYYKNGILEKKGIVNTDFQKIGKWNYYKSTGDLDVIREYKIIKNEQYLNQEWYINKEKDTLYYPSHCIRILMKKDTIPLNESLKALAILELSIFKDKKSQIDVILPKEGYNFNSDFSNENEIELDTFYNLANDIENQKWFPQEENYNHMVAFIKDFNTTGKQFIRGYVLEYYEQKSDSNDIIREEHRKYFEVPVYIKTVDGK